MQNLEILDYDETTVCKVNLIHKQWDWVVCTPLKNIPFGSQIYKWDKIFVSLFDFISGVLAAIHALKKVF